jgi:transposase
LDRLAARAERLDVLRRAHFGRSSERISEDQIKLALEDVETGFAREDADAEQRSEITVIRLSKSVAPIAAICPGICRARRSSSSRKARPAPAAAPFMSSARTSRSGSTGSRRSCASPSPAGRNMPAALAPTASGRPAPARLIEGGLPTEAMVADVLISKYADHLPLL